MGRERVGGLAVCGVQAFLPRTWTEGSLLQIAVRSPGVATSGELDARESCQPMFATQTFSGLSFWACERLAKSASGEGACR